MPTRLLSAFVSTLLVAAPLQAQQSPTSASPTSSRLTQGASVGTLKVDVPAGVDTFIVRGTMPIAPVEGFNRLNCPYNVLDPDGNPLNTQWEEVARLQNWTIVEFRALLRNNKWSGFQNFDVVPGVNRFDGQDFTLQSLGLVLGLNNVQLHIVDQAGALHSMPLTGTMPIQEFHRLGPNTITAKRAFSTGFGGIQAWFTVNAGLEQVELTLNWNNGTLPALPDVYFLAMGLTVPAGWDWEALLPDPGINKPFLVKPAFHILPQRWEHSYRVVIYPDDEEPLLEVEGWGVGDWSKGGYYAQDVALPNLDHMTIDLEATKDCDFDLLEQLLPTRVGNDPVNFFWPARGVEYGGMTGGVDIEHFDGVPLAVTGQPAGLLSVYVEQLRYASRQMGCIYEPDGSPIEMDNYLKLDGSTAWDLFNNEFQNGMDTPFNFDQTGPGNGTASYDPLLFFPIDYQHYIRRTKGNKTLVWLDNDPLALQYLVMDAELGRMSYFEGPGGRVSVPAISGLGSGIGRAEAWIADAIITAYAVSDDAYRARVTPWLAALQSCLEQSQMPNQMFSALDTGKAATGAPYGDGTTADYWVHRSSEQIFLMHAMRGMQRTAGMDTAELIRTCAEGIWDFAWQPGTNGILDRYPAGPIVGSRYATRDEFPDGLTDTVCVYGTHVPSALVYGSDEAADGMIPALLAYTQEDDLYDALDQFERWNLNDIGKRAAAMAYLQNILP